MNLVIDIGNSRIKLAVFQQGNIVHRAHIEREDFMSSLRQLKDDFPNATDLLVSHVGKMEQGWEEFLQENFRMTVFSHELRLPFKNLYETKTTLGLDRIALVAAAGHNFPNKNVLVIDAGTCITYDFLNEKREYFGGAISPGIQMRFKALHTFTEKLPLIEPDTKEVEYIGRSTASSIKSGVLLGAALEIDGFIALYQGNLENLTIILTGGDRLLLSKTIKNGIFAPSNFLLEGLNAILEFNKTQ